MTLNYFELLIIQKKKKANKVEHGNSLTGSLSTTVGSPILATLSDIYSKPNVLTLANTKFRWQRR